MPLDIEREICLRNVFVSFFGFYNCQSRRCLVAFNKENSVRRNQRVWLSRADDVCSRSQHALTPTEGGGEEGKRSIACAPRGVRAEFCLKDTYSLQNSKAASTQFNFPCTYACNLGRILKESSLMKKREDFVSTWCAILNVIFITYILRVHFKVCHDITVVGSPIWSEFQLICQRSCLLF